MPPVHIELDQDVVALLESLRRPAKAAARELIVLELYREGTLSSGRGAKLLGVPGRVHPACGRTWDSVLPAPRRRAATRNRG